MASGRNTPEYLTIVARTEDLRLVLQYDLISIGGSLMSCGLISPDQYSKSRNRMFTEPERAADLVQWIQDKVQGNAQNYHTFIRVLQQDYMQYSYILSKLQETYTQNQQSMFVLVLNTPVNSLSLFLYFQYMLASYIDYCSCMF